MKIKQLENKDGIIIEDLFLIEPEIFRDSRGFFYESWNQKKFNNLVGKETKFVQDNKSFSSKGVLRGLHYQKNPFAQGKLVSCDFGEIYDVAVDIRKGSPTFGTWTSAYLTSNNKNQLWIPCGFAHGFLAITDSVQVSYKTTEYWEKASEITILWNDPNLSIDWPISKFNLNTSDKDSNGLILSKILEENLL
tara:strand:+ start:13944 stop:14519 length:576 start_codon:yes stop_codon:yes gene_type:complete